MEKIRTYCRICEAACGLVAEVSDGEPVRLMPDREHPVTRGYACVKGPAMLEVHRDPDRLNRPERRRSDGSFEAIDWSVANAEIGARLRAIRQQHGPDAVAVYIGNPTAFSWKLGVYGTGFLAALGTRNFFNASSLDCQNKFYVAERIYGGYVIQPIPDVDRTQFFLCLGSNPLVSQMSFVVMPRALERLRGILSRGGRVVLANPRRTETAHALDGAEQVFIRPDTDSFLLMAMLRVLFDEKRIQPAAHLSGLDALERALRDFDVADAAAATGVPAEKIVELARGFASAPSANAYCSTGVNMGSAGSLAFYAVQALNAVTGNLDREGGARIPSRVLRIHRLARLLDRLRPGQSSRVGRFPQVATSLPTGILADEILTPGPGQVRALVCVAGNPLLSAPGSARLEHALGSLELLVTVDLYRTETGARAHYNLPATDWLERDDFPLLQVGMQPEPYVQYTRAVARPLHQRRDEGRIFTDLAEAAGLRMFAMPGGNAFARHLAPRVLPPLVLKLIGFPSSSAFSEGAQKMPERPAGTFLSRVPTKDGTVRLGDHEILAAAPREAARMKREATSPTELRLIGRRQRRSHNSWMHNVQKLRPAGDECPLYMHPLDARARGVSDGDQVLLRAPAQEATLTVRAQLDEDLMPGTVSLPHGWGHRPGAGWQLAAATGQSGVNVNLLAADGPQALEPGSGMARFNGIEVEVSRA